MEDVFNNISALYHHNNNNNNNSSNNHATHLFSASSMNHQYDIGKSPKLTDNSQQQSASASTALTTIMLQATDDDAMYALDEHNRLTGWSLWWQHARVTMKRHMIVLANNWLSYVGLRLFYFLLTYMIVVLVSRIRSHQAIIVQQLVITYTLYTCVPFLLPFMVSHFIYLPNRDKVADGSKFLQHMAGLSPVTYWLVQYLFDVPSMLLNALLFILPLAQFDYTQPFSVKSLIDSGGITTNQIYISFALLIVSFSSGSALMSYSMSGLFESPSMALVATAMYHVMTFLITSGAIVTQQKDSEQAYELYVALMTFLNPGFALTDGFRKLYQVAAPYDNQNDNVLFEQMSASAINMQLSNEISKPFQYVIDKMNNNCNNGASINDELNNHHRDWCSEVTNVTDTRQILFSNNVQFGVYVNYYSLLVYNLLALMWLILDEQNYSLVKRLSLLLRNKLFSNTIKQQQQQHLLHPNENKHTGLHSNESIVIEEDFMGASSHDNLVTLPLTAGAAVVARETGTNLELMSADPSVEREQARARRLIEATESPPHNDYVSHSVQLTVSVDISVDASDSISERQVRKADDNKAHSIVERLDDNYQQLSAAIDQQRRRQLEPPMIALDLTKSYHQLVAVDSLSLALNHEECLGLLGINGAGKSTTFSMISTKIRPDKGQLRCFGYSPQQERDLYRKQIGYDPQMSVTFYDLTCRQTLRHMAQLRGMNNSSSGNDGSSRSSRLNEAVESLLVLFDMEEHADKLMNELSGGTKRKLSLALAMICTPPVLLLDEPTAGVDPLSRRAIWHCIGNCKRRHNCSIVISSHAMEECEAICDRIALMANGRLYCLGSFQQLRKKYSQGYLIRVQFECLDHNHLSTVCPSSSSSSLPPLQNAATLADSKPKEQQQEQQQQQRNSLGFHVDETQIDGEAQTTGYTNRSFLNDMEHHQRAASGSIGSITATTIAANKTISELQGKLTSNLVARSSSIALDYVNVYAVIYRVSDPHIPRSELFKWMHQEQETFPVKFSYLISDTSLEDVFLTFARKIKQQQQQSHR